jgi:hypothetical protein
VVHRRSIPTKGINNKLKKIIGNNQVGMILTMINQRCKETTKAPRDLIKLKILTKIDNLTIGVKINTRMKTQMTLSASIMLRFKIINTYQLRKKKRCFKNHLTMSQFKRIRNNKKKSQGVNKLGQVKGVPMK